MFCCFGSSNEERERRQRNNRQTVSQVDPFVVPTTSQHSTSIPHPPPVSHGSGRRHPVVDLDRRTIELEIAPHTVPPTPGPERQQRRLEEDRRQRKDSARRPLPRPPSPVDPIVGRASPVRRDGDTESIAMSGVTSVSSADRGPRVVAFNRPGQSKKSRDKTLRTAQSNSNMSGRTLNAYEEKQMMRARETRKPNGSDADSPMSSGGRSAEKRAKLGVAHPHAHSTSSLVSSNVTRYPPSTGHTRQPSSQLSQHQLPHLVPASPLLGPDWLGVASNLQTGSQDSSPSPGQLGLDVPGGTGGRRSFFDSLTRLGGGTSQGQHPHDIVPSSRPIVVNRVKVSEARPQAAGGPGVDLLTGGVVRDPPPRYDAG